MQQIQVLAKYLFYMCSYEAKKQTHIMHLLASGLMPLLGTILDFTLEELIV